MLLFELYDKTGRLIPLSIERWKHIVRSHPEVSVELEEIKTTLEKPLLINKEEYDERICFYYKYCKNIQARNNFLMVVVKYLNGNGFVITYFYVDKIVGTK